MLQQKKKILYCDAGYGFPTEARPRRERILAVAKQIVNFLDWQRNSQSFSSSDIKNNSNSSNHELAEIVIIDCDESIEMAVRDRMKELLKADEIPANVIFSSERLDSSKDDIIYLSPDAEEVLDPHKEPPNQVVIGLLIDRRIQPNRSKQRAYKLGLKSARLALESFQDVDQCEPLNVDTVLVGMQKWWWNCETKIKEPLQECFLDAMETTLTQHIRRHPNRPLHKVKKECKSWLHRIGFRSGKYLDVQVKAVTLLFHTPFACLMDFTDAP